MRYDRSSNSRDKAIGRARTLDPNRTLWWWFLDQNGARRSIRLRWLLWCVERVNLLWRITLLLTYTNSRVSLKYVVIYRTRWTGKYLAFTSVFIYMHGWSSLGSQVHNFGESFTTRFIADERCPREVILRVCDDLIIWEGRFRPASRIPGLRLWHLFLCSLV
jgi:hypothetical protein